MLVLYKRCCLTVTATGPKKVSRHKSSLSMFIFNPPPILIIFVEYLNKFSSHHGNIIVITCLKIKQNSKHSLSLAKPQSFPRVQAAGFSNRASHLLCSNEVDILRVRCWLLIHTRTAVWRYYNGHLFRIIFFQFLFRFHCGIHFVIFMFLIKHPPGLAKDLPGCSFKEVLFSWVVIPGAIFFLFLFYFSFLFFCGEAVPRFSFVSGNSLWLAAFHWEWDAWIIFETWVIIWLNKIVLCKRQIRG